MKYNSRITIGEDNRIAEVGVLDKGTYFLAFENILGIVIKEGKDRTYTDVVSLKDGKTMAINNDTIVEIVDVDIKIRKG